MQQLILQHGVGAEIGIAVIAQVHAGVVGADINAFDTSTFLPLVCVFFGFDFAADQFFDQRFVDA